MWLKTFSNGSFVLYISQNYEGGLIPNPPTPNPQIHHWEYIWSREAIAQSYVNHVNDQLADCISENPIRCDEHRHGEGNDDQDESEVSQRQIDDVIACGGTVTMEIHCFNDDDVTDGPDTDDDAPHHWNERKRQQYFIQ